MNYISQKAGLPSRSEQKLRVYIDTPMLFIRPKNTDWAYLKTLKYLSGYINVDIVYSKNIIDIFLFSIDYISKRLRFPKYLIPCLERRVLSIKALKRKRVDVVISHSIPPIIEGKCVPLIWQYALVDPVMQIQFGRTEEQVEKESDFIRRMLPRITLLQLATDAERTRHIASYPEDASKFKRASFFMPRLQSLQPSQIIEKHSNDAVIKVLFVGVEGRRKGLDILASAINLMSPEIRSRMHLTVVSKEVEPDWFLDLRCEIHPTLSNAAVRKKMEDSHIFVMPSRFESFGLVFVEAMAAGCAIVAPDWEVQREITDYGRAGLCVKPEAAHVCGALSELVEDTDRRTHLATTGQEWYSQQFSPISVAQQYMKMFVDCC